MDKMKTISYLNSKVWYRFLKVLYVVIFCFTTLLIISTIYKSQDNPKKYIISCAWNGQSFIDENVYADETFSKNIISWSTNDRLAVAGACLTASERDIWHKQMGEFEKIVPPTNPFPGFAYDTETFANMEINALSIMKIDVHNNGSFKVTTPIETVPGILKFLGIFAIALLAEFVFFEGVRRVFYYIVLGSIKPKK